MYPSANVVLYVNTEDFFEATRRAVERRADPDTPLYLAISYDTDLLAFESLAHYCRLWIEFCRETPDLLVEIRTKSANYAGLGKLPPHPRAILAWTLSPDEVVRAYEKLTPSLDKRLQAAARAQARRLARLPVFRPRSTYPKLAGGLQAVRRKDLRAH